MTALINSVTVHLRPQPGHHLARRREEDGPSFDLTIASECGREPNKSKPSARNLLWLEVALTGAVRPVQRCHPHRFARRDKRANGLFLSHRGMCGKLPVVSGLGPPLRKPARKPALLEGEIKIPTDPGKHCPKFFASERNEEWILPGEAPGSFQTRVEDLHGGVGQQVLLHRAARHGTSCSQTSGHRSFAFDTRGRHTLEHQSQSMVAAGTGAGVGDAPAVPRFSHIPRATLVPPGVATQSNAGRNLAGHQRVLSSTSSGSSSGGPGDQPPNPLEGRPRDDFPRRGPMTSLLNFC